MLLTAGSAAAGRFWEKKPALTTPTFAGRRSMWRIGVAGEPTPYSAAKVVQSMPEVHATA
jgi:hypothetical protein